MLITPHKPRFARTLQSALREITDPYQEKAAGEGNSYKKNCVGPLPISLKCAVTLRRTWSEACRAAGRGKVRRADVPPGQDVEHDPCARPMRVQTGAQLRAHYSSHANHQTTAFLELSGR
jgi:hypothetical protein